MAPAGRVPKAPQVPSLARWREHAISAQPSRAGRAVLADTGGANFRGEAVGVARGMAGRCAGMQAPTGWSVAGGCAGMLGAAGRALAGMLGAAGRIAGVLALAGGVT